MENKKKEYTADAVLEDKYDRIIEETNFACVILTIGDILIYN